MKPKQLYLFRQMKTPSDTFGKIFVHGYRKRNGTQVKPYWRKSPGKRIGARKPDSTVKEQIPLFRHS